ncbi:MAG: hypothetical protein APF84_09220 [Gracilibacter sp. BRH_c7a]|nr:MAG: hypothetical protein APF84_09220 [Gracilibacter sp. BRH_c7a]
MDARKIFGVIIILLGVMLLLNSTGIVEVNIGYLISNFWPMILIIIGTFVLLTNPASKIGGIITLTIGIVFQLKNLGYFDIFQYISLWPVLLILIGIWIVFGRGQRWDTDSNDSFNALGLFSGSSVRSVSQQFQGGSATALFGGVEIDLREAQITPEQMEARVEVFAAFGGIEIIVPQGWNVIIKGIPLFGGWDNKTLSTGKDQEAPILKLNCLVMFGGLEVKN